MDSETAVRTAEKTFFASLLAGDVETLDQLLAADFLLVDVLRGAEVPKPDLLAALATGQVRFDSIDPVESRVRQYGDASVVTGRTRMKIGFGEESVEVRSRYTHVYVFQEGAWRFVSAQGTQIAE
jgi:ketosteroid isomerase-like protein